MKMTRRGMLKMSAAASAFAGMMASAKVGAQEAKPVAGGAGKGKAFVCFRIGSPLWMNEARFDELLAIYDTYKGGTDEITLFTSETHPPLPLSVIRDRMPVMAACMEKARAHGYRSGVNILSTIGHHEENLANSLSGEYTPMTDINGGVCRGTFCPNDERYRVYIKDVYVALANAKPDYIWIDDDVRLWGHAPIGGGCFCDTCIARFSKQMGRDFARDSLRDALSTGSRAEKLELRRAYLQHNRTTIGDLFRLIETTVHDIAPEMPLGFMTGDRFFEGYDFDNWADILAGPKKTPVYWRPGGGTYQDERLASITDKAHDIGRQVALLPQYVQCIESELESFPYQRLKKSAHATALEAATYIAGGCTGTAFNVMSMYDEPLGEYVPLVAQLIKVRPFLDVLATALGRTPSSGIHSGWAKDTYAAQNPDGPWFNGPGAPGHCNEIWSTGLPAAYRASSASVTAWSGDQVLALTKDEITAALKQGVYLDGPALTRLNELGLGALTGFEVAEVRHEDCIEEQTDHPLNGAFAGRRRNGRQSFWKCPTNLFKPTAEGTQTLSRCVDYTYRETAPCCLGLFENSLCGRVAVAGYYPWEQLQNLSKASQLKSVMRWLSKDTLSAYVSSFHRANLWVREKEDGTKAIALLNAYLDPTDGLELCVLTKSDTLTVTDMGCAETKVSMSKTDGVYRRFILPTINPWEIVLIRV